MTFLKLAPEATLQSPHICKHVSCPNSTHMEVIVIQPIIFSFPWPQIANEVAIARIFMDKRHRKCWEADEAEFL